MNVLILSCNTGEGHNAAGKAAKEYLEANGHKAEMLDIMSLGKKHTSGIIGGSYIKLVTYFPKGFGFIYQLGELVRKMKGRSPVYYANARLAKPLKEYLEKNDFDVIVTPHLYPAETLTYMKNKGWLKQKAVAIATDYVCIPFWEETDCDYYVIPHEDLETEFVRYGIPKEKLLPFGIPVRPAFSKRITKEQARQFLKLPEGQKIFLVMSGSMGFGKIHLFAQELVRKCRHGEQVVIICGYNKKRARTLRFQFLGNPNVRVIGFTEHVAEYMAACDVIFTKPGGLSSTEAAVKGIPIVHTAPIPGCENLNREFFVTHGMSVAADKRSSQIEQGFLLINRESTRNRMLDAQRENARPDSTEKITQLLLELTTDNRDS